jgi:hypothetical protein
MADKFITIPVVPAIFVPPLLTSAFRATPKIKGFSALLTNNSGSSAVLTICGLRASVTSITERLFPSSDARRDKPCSGIREQTTAKSLPVKIMVRD